MASSSSPGARPARRRSNLHQRGFGDESLPLGSAPLLSAWDVEEQPVGDIAGAISTRIVRLLREHTGRGPTKAKANISSDLVVVTLADCLTKAERQVAAAGHGQLVVHTRSVLHEGMRAEAIAIVEELTDQQVTAYLTAQHADPDLAILVFYLAPTLRAV